MHKNLFDLTGRRILVTGSNGGIGYSLAQGLAQHGATAILNGRNAEKLHAAAELLRKQGLSAEEARFDITDEAEVVGAIARLDSVGGVDVLINNAGIQRRISLERVDIQINSIGPGYFITEMTQVLADNPEFDAWVKARTPAQRWGNPEELVGSAVFLSSAASDFVNGQMIYVDGGMISVL